MDIHKISPPSENWTQIRNYKSSEWQKIFILITDKIQAQGE